MTFINYTLFEEYNSQGADRAATIGAFAEREQEAEQKYTKLQAEYTALITSSVASGKNATKELDVLDDKIAAAERLYKRRQQEYTSARTVSPAGIKSTDVIAGQRGYADEIGKTFVEPYIEKMQKAADLIIAASKEYREAENEYSGYFDEIKELHKSAHSRGETSAFIYPVIPFTKTSVQREIYKLVDRLNAEGVK